MYVGNFQSLFTRGREVRSSKSFATNVVVYPIPLSLASGEVQSYMFVSSVHHVAVLNTAFCMTCSLLMQFGDVRSNQIEKPES